MEYRTVWKTRALLEDELRQQMATLYLRSYDGSSRELFLRDLEDKDEVVLLWAETEVVGFTSLKIYQRQWQDRPIRVVYSGDTVVARPHWGQQALAFSWIARMGALKRDAPTLPLFWFLLVKGHRTFKYLTAFARSFWPHWSQNRSDLKPLADQLAREKFGAAYDPGRGVVEFSQSQGHLKADLAEPTREELRRADTQAFLQLNPGFRLGHELVCLCEIEELNMKPLTRRLFLKGSQE